MSRRVHCIYLGVEAEGLSDPPCPGELGERILNHVSKKAWGLWQNQQTMLINEYRLSAIDPKAREFLTKEMEKFLFLHNDAKIPQFVSPKEG